MNHDVLGDPQVLVPEQRRRINSRSLRHRDLSDVAQFSTPMVGRGIALGTPADWDPARWYGRRWRWSGPGRPPGDIDDVETVSREVPERRDCYCWRTRIGEWTGLRTELKMSTTARYRTYKLTRRPFARYYIQEWEVSYVLILNEIGVVWNVVRETCKGAGCNPEYSKDVKVGPPEEGEPRELDSWRGRIIVEVPVYEDDHGQWRELTKKQLERYVRQAVLDDSLRVPMHDRLVEEHRLDRSASPAGGSSEDDDGPQRAPRQAEVEGDAPSRGELRPRRPDRAIGDRPIREQTEGERSHDSNRGSGSSGGRGPGGSSTAPIRYGPPPPPSSTGSGAARRRATERRRR